MWYTVSVVRAEVIVPPNCDERSVDRDLDMRLRGLA